MWPSYRSNWSRLVLWFGNMQSHNQERREWIKKKKRTSSLPGSRASPGKTPETNQTLALDALPNPPCSPLPAPCGLFRGLCCVKSHTSHPTQAWPTPQQAPGTIKSLSASQPAQICMRGPSIRTPGGHADGVKGRSRVLELLWQNHICSVALSTGWARALVKRLVYITYSENICRPARVVWSLKFYANEMNVPVLVKLNSNSSTYDVLGGSDCHTLTLHSKISEVLTD
jgi:hypothetical protein